MAHLKYRSKVKISGWYAWTSSIPCYMATISTWLQQEKNQVQNSICFRREKERKKARAAQYDKKFCTRKRRHWKQRAHVKWIPPWFASVDTCEWLFKACIFHCIPHTHTHTRSLTAFIHLTVFIQSWNINCKSGRKHGSITPFIFQPVVLDATRYFVNTEHFCSLALLSHAYIYKHTNKPWMYAVLIVKSIEKSP